MNQLSNRLGQMIANNGPVILTAVAASGVIATTIAAVRGTLEAQRKVADHKAQLAYESGFQPEDIILDKRVIVEVAWKSYIPTVILGGSTLAAVIGGQVVNSKRQALLIGAYSLVDNAYKEYQAKTVEHFGEREVEKVREDIVKERFEKDGKSEQELIVIGGEKQPCYEVWSGRYFSSDMESIRKAANDLNLLVINDGYASHNDFYHKLGLSSTEMGEQLGWTTEHPMEVYFSAVLSDGKPVLTVNFQHDPIPKFFRVF